MTIAIRKRRLQGFQATGETFTDLDLSSMSAPMSKWIDCTFVDCDITLTDFSQATFERCHFVRCDLQLTSFRGASIRGGSFTECKMKQSSFIGVSPIADTGFMDCAMHYSSFFDATVYKTTFQRANLHGADLRFVEASGNEFLDTVLWNASVQMGCQLWNSKFDDRSVGMLVAIASRIHPNPEAAKMLKELAGKSYAMTSRLMAVPSDLVEAESEGK